MIRSSSIKFASRRVVRKSRHIILCKSYTRLLTFMRKPSKGLFRNIALSRGGSECFGPSVIREVALDKLAYISSLANPELKIDGY